MSPSIDVGAICVSSACGTPQLTAMELRTLQVQRQEFSQKMSESIFPPRALISHQQKPPAENPNAAQPFLQNNDGAVMEVIALPLHTGGKPLGVITMHRPSVTPPSISNEEQLLLDFLTSLARLALAEGCSAEDDE